MLWSLLVGALLGSALGASDSVSPDLVVKSVDRNIDLTTQLAKINYKISLENTGKSAVKYFLFSVDPSFKSKVKTGNRWKCIHEIQLILGCFCWSNIWQQ